MHNRHEWTERTAEGEKREVRAVKFGGTWRIQSRLRRSREEAEWTYHEPALLEDLIELRDVLFRKYQRRRAAYEDVALLEKMIGERGGQWEPSPGEPQDEPGEEP